MSCRRFEEIDPAAYLTEPGAERWQSFREHFPGCAMCAEAVAEWTALENALRASGDLPDPSGAHPAPERIAAMAKAPDSVPQQERRQIREHLDACRLCSDEYAALKSFDFEKLVATAPLTPRRALRKVADSVRDLGAVLVGRSSSDDDRSWLGRRDPRRPASGARLPIRRR